MSDEPTPAPGQETMEITRDLLTPLCNNLAFALQGTGIGFVLCFFEAKDFAPGQEIGDNTPMWPGQNVGTVEAVRAARAYADRVERLAPPTATDTTQA